MGPFWTLPFTSVPVVPSASRNSHFSHAPFFLSCCCPVGLLYTPQLLFSASFQLPLCMIGETANGQMSHVCALQNLKLCRQSVENWHK